MTNFTLFRTAKPSRQGNRVGKTAALGGETRAIVDRIVERGNQENPEIVCR